MAFWDFIKRIRQDEEDEKRNQSRGNDRSVGDRAFGFLDDIIDTTGRAYNKVQDIGDDTWVRDRAEDAVGFGAGLLREATTKVGATAKESMEQRSQEMATGAMSKTVEELKGMSYDARKKALKENEGLRIMLNNRGITDPTDKNLTSALEKRKKEQKDSAKPFTPDSPFEKLVFGNEPIQSYQERNKGLNEDWKDELGVFSAPAAVLGTAANLALDVPGASTAKTAGKKALNVAADNSSAIKQGVSRVDDFIDAAVPRVRSAVDRARPGARQTDEIVPAVRTDISSDLRNAPDLDLNVKNVNIQTLREGADTTPVKDLDEKQVLNYMDKYRRGEPIDPIVTSRGPEGDLLQDGAHRAEAARRLGIAELPSVTRNPKPVMDDLVSAAEPPTKPPVSSIPPAGGDGPKRFGDAAEGMLNRMKTTEQIEKMKPKAGVVQRAYESGVNSKAQLDVFNAAYKGRTGKDLAVIDDPAKLLQLNNGLDDAVKQRIAPTLDRLGKLNKDEFDAVKILGESRQIVDHADKHAPDVVANARQAIQEVEASLVDPASRAKVNDGLKAMSEHSDGILQMLVDSGDLTDEAYAMIKEANPNYFAKRRLVSHLLSSKPNPMFTSKSNSVSRDKVIQAVKGMSEESEILDPIESMVATTRATMDRVTKSRAFDAAKAFSETNPELVVPLRNAEDVIKRMDISYDNRQLRGVRDKLDTMAKSQSKLVRRVQSEVDKLNKAGLDTSLKETKEGMPEFSVAGLGGKVPTSKATDQLGPRDTATFLRNLVSGPNKEITKIKKMIGNREPKLTQFLDELQTIKGEYDDVATEIRSNSGEIQKLMDADVPKGYKAVSRIKNGVTERIALPEEVADTWMGMNEAQRDVVGKMSKYLGRPLRAAVTTLSLPFQFVRNPIRDARQTMFTSKAVPIGEYITVLPYMKRWAGGFMEALKDGDFAKQIREAGGGGAGLFNDYNDTRNVVKELERKVAGPNLTTPKGVFEEAKRILGKAYGGVERAGRALEYAPRLAEAKAVKNAGGTIEDAASAARNVTVDFDKAGKTGRILNDYVTFLNARVQGNANVISAIKRDPKRAGIAAVANIAIPAAAVYAWNRGQYGEVYDQISQDIKDNNFVLILGDEQDEAGNFTQVLKIPKNEPDKVFGNIAEYIASTVAGEATKSPGQVIKETAAGVLPIDVMKDGAVNASRAVSSILPTALKTPVELATNKNLYFDSPIVSESMQDLPNEMQVKDSTSGAAKFLGNLIGASPIKTDQAIRGVTGNLLTKNPVDALGGAVVGANNRGPKDEFYRIKNDVSRERAGASKLINDAIADGDMAEAQRISTEYNQKLIQSYLPWVERHGNNIDEDLAEELESLALNLNKQSVTRRRKEQAKKLEKSTR